MTREAVQAALRDWDGRAKAGLEDLCRDYRFHAEFSTWLTELAFEDRCADAATWCLKHIWERKDKLPDIARLVEAAARAPGWAAKLHTLQMLDRSKADVPEAALEKLVDQALASRKPMLKAWGYSGADALGLRFPKHRARVRVVLAQARARETAASIQARLKKCKL